jgi:Domain of unknown function (DUF4136)
MGTPRRFLFSVLAAAALAAACAGTHPPPQFVFDPKASFTGLSTYAWYVDPSFTIPHGDSIIDGRFIDQHVRAAVDADLARKGFQLVSGNNITMYVSYRTGDTGVASEDKDPNYEWLTGYSVSTMYEKERSITIEIRDRNKKLIWRGGVTRLEGTNPDAAGRELDREIGTLLAKFPPSTGQ